MESDRQVIRLCLPGQKHVKDSLRSSAKTSAASVFKSERTHPACGPQASLPATQERFSRAVELFASSAF